MDRRVVDRLTETVTSITLTRLVRRYLTAALLFVGVLTAAGVFLGLDSIGAGTAVAVVGAILAAVGVVAVLFRVVVLPLAAKIEGTE